MNQRQRLLHTRNIFCEFCSLTVPSTDVEIIAEILFLNKTTFLKIFSFDINYEPNRKKRIYYELSDPT